MSPAFAVTNLLDSTEFLVGTALLITILLGGAVVIWYLDRWRKQQERSATESTESLTNFRALFENGEITEEEYKRIRGKVSTQMRLEVGLPAPPPVAVPPPEPESPMPPPRPTEPTP